MCLKSKVLDKSNDPSFLKEISIFDIVYLSDIKSNMNHINLEGYKTVLYKEKQLQVVLVLSLVALLFQTKHKSRCKSYATNFILLPVVKSR